MCEREGGGEGAEGDEAGGGERGRRRSGAEERGGGRGGVPGLACGKALLGDRTACGY